MLRKEPSSFRAATACTTTAMAARRTTGSRRTRRAHADARRRLRRGRRRRGRGDVRAAVAVRRRRLWSAGWGSPAACPGASHMATAPASRHIARLSEGRTRPCRW